MSPRILFCVIFVWTVIVGPVPEAGAQGVVKKAVSACRRSSVGKGMTPAQIEKILLDRVKRTKNQVPRIPPEELECLPAEDFPSQEIVNWPFRRGPVGPYEDLSFWNTLSPQAKRNYFLAANNRASALSLKQRLQIIKALRKQLPDFWQERLVFPHQPLEDTLLQSIPSGTKYILVGEEHNYSQIQVFLARFLQKYKQQYPHQKVFLLTEFLPTGKNKTALLQHMKKADGGYGYLLNRASSWGITVKGLEARYVFFNDAKAVLDSRVPDESTVDLWTVPESMHLRNRYWLSQIQQLREQYPDAVFIIYAGAEHVSYNTPFNLTKALPQEELFVAHLFSSKPTNNEARDLLDFLGEDKYPFYLEEILAWKDESMRRLAGFDMRLLINEKDYAIK